MSLTPEQILRMKKQRELALEKKRQRQSNEKSISSSSSSPSKPSQPRLSSIVDEDYCVAIDPPTQSPYFNQTNSQPSPNIPAASFMQKYSSSVITNSNIRQSFPPTPISQFSPSPVLSGSSSVPSFKEFDVQSQFNKIGNSFDYGEGSNEPSSPDVIMMPSLSSNETKNKNNNRKRFHVPAQKDHDITSEKQSKKPPSAFDVMMNTNTSSSKARVLPFQSNQSIDSLQAPSYYHSLNSKNETSTKNMSSNTMSEWANSSKSSAPPGKPAFVGWNGKPPKKAKKDVDSDGVVLSDEQNEVVRLALSGVSIFFTGNAGTGKSTLLKEIIKELQLKNGPESLAVTASTGAAATLISGTTIHSFSGCGLAVESAKDLCTKVTRNKTSKKRWVDVSSLVIDEISMMDADLFDKLNEVGKACRKSRRPFGGIQLILCGDFFQLPPVCKDKVQKFCFESPTWSEAIDRSIVLKTVFRQKNQVFVDCLNECRNAKLSNKAIALLKRAKHHKLNDPEPTRLCAFNNAADRTNQMRLSSLEGGSKIYEASDKGRDNYVQQLKKNSQAPNKLELKIGAKVILLKNLDLDWGLCNGSRGTVIAFTDSVPDDEDDKDEEESEACPIIEFRRADGLTMKKIITREEFNIEVQGKTEATRSQLPLKLAWAISIHKSQGMTIDCLEVDLQGCFECGQAYVALSRATCFDQLRVLNFDPKLVKANSKVAEFYKTLDSV